jgi:predicted nucleotidyltransferase
MARRSASPSLLPLLRSETQAGVLERLVLNPEQSYTVAGLARRLGVTDMSVRRELHRLVEAGIAEREVIGRQGVFRASVASPLFEPLRELVERSVGAEALIRDVLEQTAGIEAAAIFGSWARGRVDAQSDIDLLVVGDFDYAHLVEDLMLLQERTGREINLVSLRAEELAEQRDSGFVQDILASPMRMLMGTLDQGEIRR